MNFTETELQVGSELLKGATDDKGFFFIDNYFRRYSSYDESYYIQKKVKREGYYITHIHSGILLVPFIFDTEVYAKIFVERLAGLQDSFFDWREKNDKYIFLTEDSGAILHRIYNALIIEEGK